MSIPPSTRRIIQCIGHFGPTEDHEFELLRVLYGKEWSGYEKRAFCLDNEQPEADVIDIIDDAEQNPLTKLVFFDTQLYSGPALSQIRAKRKDITLALYVVTSGLSRQDLYAHALGILKSASANLVMAEDRHSGQCMVVAPEEAAYHQTTEGELADAGGLLEHVQDRLDTLKGLVEMVRLRTPRTDPSPCRLSESRPCECVMLHNHGPNIVFHRSADPQAIIDFIEKNFILTEKTGGYQIPAEG